MRKSAEGVFEVKATNGDTLACGEDFDKRSSTTGPTSSKEAALTSAQRSLGAVTCGLNNAVREKAKIEHKSTTNRC